MANFIGNETSQRSTAGPCHCATPPRGEVFAEAPNSGPADAAAAVRAAAGAFERWRDTTPSERARALLRLADAVEERAGEFVAAEKREHRQAGPATLDEEIPPTADAIRFFAGAARAA
jgi:betaine-aldehyde dehydrogenase